MADENIFPMPEGAEAAQQENYTEAQLNQDTDYDPQPVFMDDGNDPADDVNIVLDDGTGTQEDEQRNWYVVHCYSGYENKVRHAIEQRIETMGMRDRIFDVIIPTEEEIEVKDGKRKTVEKRVFPGYILVEMVLDEDSWYVVRNTPGVTGFVGMGNDPTPLREEEVKAIMDRMDDASGPTVRADFKIGQKVRIVGGPFNDFIGTVNSIDSDKLKVRVMVDFFGRETPVELGFLEVEKV
ncbi:transcription termination/antitermination protein NusG [Phototrophicus methaneseepsis]|nr:transcription termination/antitermination protein NusG [Phototrophicus methaneseepsis]